MICSIKTVFFTVFLKIRNELSRDMKCIREPNITEVTMLEYGNKFQLTVQAL
jgi:hypothetical protein